MALRKPGVTYAISDTGPLGREISVHEPKAHLLNAQDAIQDAKRLRGLLFRNRKRADRGVT